MLKADKISFQDFNIRGKWNINKMTEWTKNVFEQFKNDKRFIPSVNLDDFYKEFYMGSKTIKYINYYSRKHLMNCLKKLNINGLVATSKNRLMIKFIIK